ncbi:MAG: dihydrolipoamide acetyltransferase family protein [Bacilli bacterium]
MLEFKLPQTADDIAESLIVIWYKSEGEYVQAGETLVEVQTEKATFELASPAAGVVGKILVKRAEVAAVGDVLALIETDLPHDGNLRNGSVRETAQGTQGSEPAPPEDAATPGGFVAMAPRLRRLAQQLGVNPATVLGTGPHGRVTEADIRGLGSNDPHADSVGGSLSGLRNDPEKIAERQTANTSVTSATRRTIADRMLQSLQHSAQLTLTTWADVTLLAQKRKLLAAEASWNDWVLRAVCKALGEHPNINASWTDRGIVRHADVSLGVAVDTEDGLFVPVIRQASQLTLQEIHREAGRLAEQARLHRLSVQELTGSTFTVTNLGGFGIEFFTPILNPPEAGILGVGKLDGQITLQSGNLAVRQRLPLSLTFDHRVLDGGPAARFLQTVAQLLAEPEQLV